MKTSASSCSLLLGHIGDGMTVDFILFYRGTIALNRSITNIIDAVSYTNVTAVGQGKFMVFFCLFEHNLMFQSLCCNKSNN